ncbi:N-acetyltransferase family protein [Streptococcus sp. ZJ93]|uniref:GNAT family N-acetyltransferase n=1 Tax=Streptococcus handemini TaxID=3161188 RepID=UPI0032F05573
MLTITPMVTDDEKERKAYVHWKAWTEAYSQLLPEHFWKEYTLERCRKWAFAYPNDVFVAKIEDKVVGFVCCAASQQEDLENMGEIYAIYILSEYYGQQIGYRLMQFALEQLKDFSQVVLWVLDGNERAIRFYECIGFCFDGASKRVHLGKELVEKRMIYKP